MSVTAMRRGCRFDKLILSSPLCVSLFFWINAYGNKQKEEGDRASWTNLTTMKMKCALKIWHKTVKSIATSLGTRKKKKRKRGNKMKKIKR